MFRWRRLFIIGASATATHCAAYLWGRREKKTKKKTVRCRVSTRDKLPASHAGLHLSNVQRCWHRLSSGNWRHKLKRIDNAAATLQSTVAEHCCLSAVQMNCSRGCPPYSFTKINLLWHGSSPNHLKSAQTRSLTLRRDLWPRNVKLPNYVCGSAHVVKYVWGFYFPKRKMPTNIIKFYSFSIPIKL